MLIEFRPYQIDIIQKVLDYIEQDKKLILINLIMAGGKTAVMRGIVSGLEVIYGQLNVLVVTPFNTLKDQVKETFGNISISVETYGEAVSKGVRTFDILFLDEAHHVGSEVWGKVPYLARAKAIIGLSGTPFRVDQQPLLKENGGIFSYVINGPSWDDLTQQSYLAKLRYYAYPLIETVVQVPYGKYIRKWKEEKVYSIDNREKDTVKEYQENFAGKSAIVFCRSFQHSQEMAERFKAVGIKADYMSCYRKKLENDVVKADMLNGNLQVLCTVNMGSVGLNIPKLKVGIMAREIINSENLYLQQIGRPIRPFNNQEASILDLVGNIYRMGHPQQLLKEKVIV